MSVSKRTAQTWNTCIIWGHRATDCIQGRQLPYLPSNKRREMKEYSRCISSSSVAVIKHYSQQHALEGRMTPQGSVGVLRFHHGGRAAWQQVSGMVAGAGNLKITSLTANRKQKESRKWGALNSLNCLPPVMDYH